MTGSSAKLTPGTTSRILPARKALFAFVLCMAMTGPSTALATTTYVDGISDQSMSEWDNNFSGSYFAGFFKETWLPGSHIKYSRYVAQWDMMIESGKRWEELSQFHREHMIYLRKQFEGWVQDAGGMGLSLDLSLTAYKEMGFPNSSAEFKEQLTADLNRAAALGHPISYVEAWNEPNEQGNYGGKGELATPVAVAHFTNEASAVCKARSPKCTVIAGNLYDKSGARQWEKEYTANLNPVPANWGVHPYESVETRNSTHYWEAEEGIPTEGEGVHTKIWFTELAAFKCWEDEKTKELHEHGLEGQAERVDWLENSLMLEAKPEHVFYYGFLLKDKLQPQCSEHDGYLYVPSSDPNAPDAPRPAAAWVYDNNSTPWGYTGGASGIGASSATLTASIYPDTNYLDTKYHFEYGTTTGYGSYSAEGNAGSGISMVGGSMGVGSLTAGTTYHYRVVAWNQDGTEYGADRTFVTPPPPSVTTGTASEAQETSATLNGTVNPNGYDTRYYFQYGTSTAYGLSTGEVDVGSGVSPMGVTGTITGLQPGTTYHYRLVANNEGGTSYGGDGTLTTLPDFGTSDWTVRTPSTDPNGWQWTFYRGAEGKLTTTYYTGSGWGSAIIGNAIASGTTPAVLRQPSTNPNADMWVYYQGADGQLTETYYTEGSGWKTQALGVWMASDTSPSAVRLPTSDPNGWQWVYYQDPSNQLHYAYFTGSDWGNLSLGLAMAPGTSPSVVRLPTAEANGWQWVYYQDSAHQLHYAYFTGSEWGNLSLGLVMAPATSPSVVRVPTTSSNGWQWVYYQDSADDLHYAYFTGSGWGNTNLGMPMSPNTSPSAVRLASLEPNDWQWIFYQDSGNSLHEVYYTGTGWANQAVGGQMKPSTSPSVVRLPTDEANGWQWAFYDGSNETLHDTYYAPTGWASLDLSAPMYWF